MNAVALAVADVEQSFRQLEFAIKLMCYCELDQIDRTSFDTGVTLLLKEENMGFPSGTFATQESMVQASQIQVAMAFGISAIVLDAAYESAGVPRNPKDRSAEGDLRTLVYMVRCAFAHNMAAPVWGARGADFARSFSLYLCGSRSVVDLSAFNGQPFDYSHIGGFAQWFKIKQAVVKSINGT